MRQGLFNFRKCFFDFLCGRDRISPIGFRNCPNHRILGIISSITSLNFSTKSNICHIIHGNRYPITNHNQCFFDVFKRLNPPKGTHYEFGSCLVNKGTGYVLIRRCQRLSHVFHRDSISEHTLRNEAHLVLLDLTTQGNYRSYAT